MTTIETPTTIIRRLLERRGMQEQVVAHSLGLSKSGLSRKMNGSRRWKAHEKRRLASLLGVEESSIFGEA